MAQDVYHYWKKESGVVVIGSGMIAGAMRNVSGWDNDVVFSSGVSNSGEKNEDSYVREIILLNNQLEKLDQSSFIVYFSTTSIYDTAKTGNPYILHKLNVESILRSSNKNYIILRLPNLVGLSTNPNTLTNYFADRIRSGKEVSLNRYAIRHLIDVDDLPFILNDIVRIFGKRF